jgi:hypothetical protein
MADPVFLYRRKLGKSLAESGRLKHRIVTETGDTSRLIDDRPFDYAFESAKRFALARQSKHTAETRGKWTLLLRLAQFGPQSFDVLAVLRAGAGVARGLNTGRALERIDFETGIVRDHQSGKQP